MSIDTLLKELVATVEGSTGAILLAADGEAVQWYSSDGEQLRLRGAYVAVVLRTFRATSIQAKLGGLNRLTLAYDGASFVAEELADDCLLVLELRPAANLAQALFHIKPVVQRLRREIEL